MPEFASQHDYHQFRRSITTKEASVVHEDAFVHQFLETVCRTVKQRLKPLRKDEILFRAQPGCALKEETILAPRQADGAIEYEETVIYDKVPLSPERMIPKAEFVRDGGRVCAKGIPCLYLATTQSAVISEMRPWVGEYITIARFRIVRDCHVVDCSLDTMESWFFEFESTNLNDVNLTDEAEEPEAKAPDAATKEKGVWGDIGFAFSKPVSHGEPRDDYIPTQRLAEAFRNSGYDGILYKSLLTENGKNIALFDPDTARLNGESCLYKTQSAEFQCLRVDPEHGYQAPPWCGELITSKFKERL